MLLVSHLLRYLLLFAFFLLISAFITRILARCPYSFVAYGLVMALSLCDPFLPWYSFLLVAWTWSTRPEICHGDLGQVDKVIELRCDSFHYIFSTAMLLAPSPVPSLLRLGVFHAFGHLTVHRAWSEFKWKSQPLWWKLLDDHVLRLRPVTHKKKIFPIRTLEESLMAQTVSSDALMPSW